MIAKTFHLFLIALLIHPAAFAQQEREDSFEVRPDALVPRPSAEYYSLRPSKHILIPVRVWGEIAEGGIHYVPTGASLADVVSAAGGPGSKASLSDVSVIRGKSSYSLDIKEPAGADFVMQKDDTVFVDYSIKRDLPMIFTAISTIVSVLTLYFVTTER